MPLEGVEQVCDFDSEQTTGELYRLVGVREKKKKNNECRGVQVLATCECFVVWWAFVVQGGPNEAGTT